MTDHPRTSQLSPTIRAALDLLRRQIRRYVWAEGLAVAAVWLAVAFWFGLAIDWFFEPPTAARAILLGSAAVVLAVIVYWRIVRPSLVRLTDRNLAMLFERRFPQFRESLLTAVELTGRPLEPGECNPWLLQRACQLAEETVPKVRPRDVFNPTPLWRSASGAILLALSVAMFALAWPASFDLWARRNLLLSDQRWPRQTRLLVDGFAHGPVKVARGSDLDITAKADLARPLVPQTVEIRYRTDEGASGRATMSREGVVNRTRDQFQEYSHTFRGILTPVSFDVVGGDDAVRNLRIEVVESPTIIAMTLECDFPRYMARPRRTLAVSGPMPIPAGTRVIIHARANKDLQQVTLQSAFDDPPKPPQVLSLAGRPDPRSFDWEIPALGKDQTLLFTLLDTDQIRSREPVRLNLACLPDEAPKLALRLAGIGPAITPTARLPVAGHITDDYGIARTWFEYTVDQKKTEIRPIAEPPGNPTNLQASEVFEAADLKLKPGQKLLLSVKAADHQDLTDKPNVGTSERWLLDIVTPEQLRNMLQARELVLRQRFEAIISEVTETRDSLVHLEPGEAPPTLRKVSASGDGFEPGDRAAPAGAPSAQSLGLETLRIQRAMQNSRKDSHEVLGIAESIDDIHQELINNRIDTTELRLRLQQGISQPLRHVADQMFPEFDQRLDQLAASLADPKLGPQARDAARQQCDAILVAMRQVLGRMLELEDFNEAVELLRGIIASQQKLDDETQKRHKQTLRDLLEK